MHIESCSSCQLWTAISLLVGITYTRPALSSNVSPFLGGAIAALILLTALIMLQWQSSLPAMDPSCSDLVVSWLYGPRRWFRSRRKRSVWFGDLFGLDRTSFRGLEVCDCGRLSLMFKLSGRLGAASSLTICRGLCVILAPSFPRPLRISTLKQTSEW